jgi:hypothetical protein
LCTPSAFLCGWNISFATIPFHISMCRLDTHRHLEPRNKVQSLETFWAATLAFSKTGHLAASVRVHLCLSPPTCGIRTFPFSSREEPRPLASFLPPRAYRRSSHQPIRPSSCSQPNTAASLRFPRVSH